MLQLLIWFSPGKCLFLSITSIQFSVSLNDSFRHILISRVQLSDLGGITLQVREAIENRRSIRKYVRKEIPEETLNDLLDAARLAPSGMNKQPWEIVVITDQKKKEELVPVCNNQRFIADCSAFLIGIDDPKEKWMKVDLAIALDHLSLAATEKGLGTCWIGAFDRDKLADFIGLPPDKMVTVCMTLGYPDHSPNAPSKDKLEELFQWNSYPG